MKAWIRIAGITFAIAMLGVLANTVTGSEPELNNGIYQGTGEGMNGPIVMEIIVDGNAIEVIHVLEQKETVGVGDKAVRMLAVDVAANQSLGVDSISGATVSSEGAKKAIADAIEKAGGDSEAWRNREVYIEEKEETLEYDVVVVGSGLTGLTAALAAEKNGAQVALLEEQGIPGENSIYHSGSFEEIDPEVLALYEESGAFFASEELSEIQAGEPLITSIGQILYEDCVNVFLNTCVEELIEEENGSVTGVIARSKNGKKTFLTKAVIFAEEQEDLCLEANTGYLAGISVTEKEY